MKKLNTKKHSEPLGVPGPHFETHRARLHQLREFTHDKCNFHNSLFLSLVCLFHAGWETV